MLGVYHSHPNGKNEPSRRDMERAYSGYSVLYFVAVAAVTLRAILRDLRLFDSRRRVTQLEIKIVR
jgi:proteasome lid subunit RPN8/RPN11